MPNRRMNRNKNRRQKVRKQLSPSDVDKLIKELNESNRASPALKKFLVYVLERKVYGPDVTNEFVIFALSSYFILRNKYLTFSIMFNFPPKEFLEEEVLRDFKFMPGVRDTVSELLKIKIENCEPLSKICVLIMDESTLKSETKYCQRYGSIVGVEDDGKTKGTLPANFVTNIWIHSVGGQWMLPFAYYFTHKSCSAASLKEYLFDTISKLESIGLDVVGIVTKMRVNFYELSQLLNISSTNQTFKVKNKKIVFLFDVPQLMNITRNNLMKYKFKFNETKTSWKYVKQFFIKESQDERKTKLTMAHIKPDQQQRICPTLAIELLSNTVATEMTSYISLGKLSPSATGTAECIDLFDKLFDILNSSNEVSINEYSSAYKGTKHQTKFLQKMISFFENLKIFDSSDQDCTDQIKFINGWLISIKGMMKLWDIVHQKKHPYLLTRNINCESLDKFTWLLRWQIFTFKDPTPCCFLEIYSSFFVTSYFQDSSTEESDNSEFDISDYTSKVFNRIPPVKHDLTGQSKMAAGSAQSEEAASSSNSEHSGLTQFSFFGDLFLRHLLDTFE